MTYTLTFYRPEAATAIAILNTFRALRLTRGISRVGAMSLTIDLDALDFVPPLDTRIVVTREIDGYSWLIGGYLVRGVQRSLNNGDESYNIRARCYNSLTERRIVAYQAASAFSDKTGCADNIMKAVIRENLGTLADTGRNIAAYGLTVEADLSLAGTVSAAFAWKGVYDTLGQIADTALASRSERVYWDMRPVDVGWSCQFIARKDYIGADRRYTGTNNPILISPEVGNVSAIDLDDDRAEEVNYILAAGQGVDDDRSLATAEDATRIAASPINRMEGFFDGRNYETAAGLEAAAKAKLSKGEPVHSFGANLTETEYFRLGRDFAPGDLLTVSYAGEQNVFVRGCILTITTDSENVGVVLEAV